MCCVLSLFGKLGFTTATCIESDTVSCVTLRYIACCQVVNVCVQTTIEKVCNKLTGRATTNLLNVLQSRLLWEFPTFHER